MKIKISTVFVNDQTDALKFYTEVLGFEKKNDIPLGEEHRWLTVVAADGPNDLELLLEPNAHPAAISYQQAIFADNIPATMFFVDDIATTHSDLEGRGVKFIKPPTDAGGVKIAIFDDTCGNLIQLVQE